MKRSLFLAASGSAVASAAFPRRARAADDLVLTTPTGALYGTLERPAAANASTPVVLLIAGSGPTDRDGNTPALPGKNDALKLLAQGLAARGIASLRYDKRGIAASAAAMRSEAELRFDDYVADAVAWIGMLRERKQFGRIAIAGHSEGSLIGMLAAARTHTDGYASLNGAGRPAAAILREQLAHQASIPPERLALANHILDELSAGRVVNDLPADLAALFRPSIQRYEMSWFTYDPAKEIAHVPGAAAIVQGTADVQCTLADAEALRSGLPSARYVVVDGMNHMLKHAPDHSTNAALIAGYTDPTLPVEPAVVDAVAAVARG